MKKRILSILLLCCMVLTLLPTAAFAAGEIDEQFTLAPGGTYYFDLSAMGIPGTVNDALPDKTMRYVPFTYAGTVDSYGNAVGWKVKSISISKNMDCCNQVVVIE